MPDSNGAFKGISIPGDAWTRIFGPALADDPAYEFDAAASGRRAVEKHTDALQRLSDSTCPAGHGRCPCLPGSTSEAYCYASLYVPSEPADEVQDDFADWDATDYGED